MGGSCQHKVKIASLLSKKYYEKRCAHIRSRITAEEYVSTLCGLIREVVSGYTLNRCDWAGRGADEWELIGV